MRSGLTSVCLCLMSLTAVASASASNIVLNPGFELGTAGWTFNTSFTKWHVADPGFTGDAGPHSGTADAATPCVDIECITADPSSLGAWLYQDLITVPGQAYDLSFWFASTFTSLSPNAHVELKVLFGSTVAFDLLDVARGGVRSTYAQYTSSTPLIATSTITRLEFLGRSDPGWIALDDVSVSPASTGGVPAPVPEPTSSLLMASGLVGLACLTRWRRRAPAAGIDHT